MDASDALALVLAEDEGDDVAALLQSIMEQNGQFYVPELFWYEVCNGLLSAERQGRIDSDATKAAIAELGRLPIVCHPCGGEPFLTMVSELARKHGLTYYDAVYLELALRHQARLKSYDRHLVSLGRDYPDVIL